MSPATDPAKDDKPRAEHEILKQSWFKSVGPRTYAAQVKKAGNGNHFLVLTEGRRDEKTGDVRKNRIFLFSEDFAAFFKMMQEAAVFIRENPVPPEIKARQEKRWAKQRDGTSTSKSDDRPPQRRGNPPGAANRRANGPNRPRPAPSRNERSSAAARPMAQVGAA